GASLVVQRQGQRAASNLEGVEGQRPAAPARRLRIRQPEDSSQHQERDARRRGQAFRQGLPRAWHRHARHLHSRSSGQDKETIEETIRFAIEINPHTIQISLAAPYPGTFLHKQALENHWLVDENAELLTEHGTQVASLSYPHLSHTEIFKSVDDF